MAMISPETFEKLAAEVDFSLSGDVEESADQWEEEGAAQFLEIKLEPDSVAVGKTVAELNLPEEAVLVSIRRKRQVLIPRGKTRLESEDTVNVLCRADMAKIIRDLLESAALLSAPPPAGPAQTPVRKPAKGRHLDRFANKLPEKQRGMDRRKNHLRKFTAMDSRLRLPLSLPQPGQARSAAPPGRAGPGTPGGMTISPLHNYLIQKGINLFIYHT